MSGFKGCGGKLCTVHDFASFGGFACTRAKESRASLDMVSVLIWLYIGFIFLVVASNEFPSDLSQRGHVGILDPLRLPAPFENSLIDIGSSIIICVLVLVAESRFADTP